MEKQSFQETLTGTQYQHLRDRLTNWTIVPGYQDTGKHVIVRPSLEYEAINRNPGSYNMRTTVSLYFFGDCNTDAIFLSIDSVHIKIISYSENWENNSRELGIKDSGVLPYTKFVIEYSFVKNWSCTSC